MHFNVVQKVAPGGLRASHQVLEARGLGGRGPCPPRHQPTATSANPANPMINICGDQAGVAAELEAARAFSSSTRPFTMGVAFPIAAAGGFAAGASAGPGAGCNSARLAILACSAATAGARSACASRSLATVSAAGFQYPFSTTISIRSTLIL